MSVTEDAPATTSFTPRPPQRRHGASAFVSLSKAAFKGFVREKAAVFWMLLFPLMFLVIFGLLFSEDATSKTEIGVVGDGVVVDALRDSGAVELTPVESEDAALQQVRDGDLPAYVAQNGGDVTLRFAATDPTQSGMVEGLVGGVISEANVQASGQQPQFQLSASQVEDESLTPIQYLTPGLLAWAVAMSASFGSALTLVSWRKNQVLRRLRLAPVTPATVLSSRLAVAIGTALLQGVIFIALALTPVYGLQLSGQWWLGIPLLMLGTLAFFAIGMLVGAFSKTEEAASGVANLIILPMAFLSGAFFPIDQTPQWLQNVSQVLPMRHLNDGLSAVLVRGQGVGDILLPAGILVGFSVVVGLIAVRMFRWEDS